MSGPALRGPTSGGRVGPYALEEPLGSGGNATVFRARDPDGELIAVKVLHPASVGTDHARRFTREYLALRRLSHPNIVRVLGAGVDDSFPWIAMELVQGRDLDQEIAVWNDQDPPDRWARAERILRGLCGALSHLHERGLVHRDLKPANVLIDAHGEPRLSDFGVVKDFDSAATALTRHGNLVGTIAFMAPEQIADEPVDARTDLYSLGAVLYALLTGRKPIEADSLTGFLARHLTHVPDPPSAIRPDVPRRLEAICQRLLFKDRDQRFASAGSVLAALDDDEDPDRLPLRGREASLSLVRERLTDLADGVGGVVAAVGPDGSGRSSWIDAALSAAADLGLAYARASGAAANPITDLLANLDPGAAEQPAAGHLRALADVVRAGPTVLALDDADRLTATMQQAVARLVHKLIVVEVAPLLLLLTTRPGPASSALVEGTETGLPANLIELGGLDRDAMRLALRDRGLIGAAAGPLTKRFLDELEGLPGAVHAQLAALVDEGWLKRTDGRLVAALPPKELARRPLPVPGPARIAHEARLAQVDPESLHVLEILAVLGRPADAALLQRACGASTTALHRLIEAGHAQVDQGAYRLGAPWLQATVFRRIHPVERQRVHATIARALAADPHRGLSALVEQARHHEAAGEPSAALPLLVRAARFAAREHRPHQVLDLTAHALRILPAAERSLDPGPALELATSIHLLRGEALLARGRWAEAEAPLAQAVDGARAQGAPALVGRAAAGLGRALYHAGAADRASPLLIEATHLAPEGSAERAYATRALADLHLRRGELDLAEGRWRDAQRGATTADARARAVRGLAHLRVLQGRLADAASLLDQADTLLQSGGDPAVRAAVLGRAVELDLTAGRFATAIHRARVLVELVRHHEIDSRLAIARLTELEALMRAGVDEGLLSVLGAAQTALKLDPPRAGALGLRLARSLLDLGQPQDALAALPDAADLDSNAIDDPAAQHAALRARALAATHPTRARELAGWALRRDPPRLILQHVALLLDAARALADAGDPGSARATVKRGLAATEGEGLDGARLEFLIAFSRIDSSPEVRATLARVQERLSADLPEPMASQLARRAGPPAP